MDNFKKTSSWAATLFAPTLVEMIYGMNFEDMPELGWSFGYPFAIGLMGVVCMSLCVFFKRRDWLWKPGTTLSPSSHFTLASLTDRARNGPGGRGGTSAQQGTAHVLVP